LEVVISEGFYTSWNPPHLKTKENQIVTRYFASTPIKHNPKITPYRGLSQNQFFAVSGFIAFTP